VGPDGALLCEFEKIHPFTLGKEVDYFTGGDAVKVYPWVTGKEQESRRAGEQETSAATGAAHSALGTPHSALICPAVCYDLRFPELFRIGLIKGAEVFAIGSSWPATREQHRVTLSIARAIENQAFVLSVNRCGKDPTLEYAGGTLAISPRGEVLGQLGGVEGVLSVPIDMDDLRRWRRTFPAWKDHRLIGRTS
jgi:predicted amidohydrolase